MKYLSISSKIAIGIIICLIISVQSGYGQEVDQSRSNKKKLRETKFKTRNKQGEKKYKGDITGRKKRTKKTKNRNKISSPSSAPYGNVLYQGTDRKKEGKDVRQSDGFYNTPSRPTENHRKGDISGRKPRRSVTHAPESKSVQAPSNPYAGRKNRSEKQKAKSSRAQGGGFQSVSSSGRTDPKKIKRIQPRTASRAFIARKKVNAYAGRARRGERAKTKDIAGRNIRSKNFRSRSQPIIQPSFNPYYAKKRKGDQVRTAVKGTGYGSASKKGERKYKGQAAGGYSTASKKGENAWRNDITGRKFKRPSDPGVTTGKKGQSYTGTQNRTLSISGALKNNNRRALSTNGAGGSVSTNIWKGKGQALPRKDLANTRISGFSGRYKRFELSPGFDTRSSKFQGNVKGSQKPLKGGGSISRSGWNNSRQALPKKDLASSSSRFSGNIKGNRKPFKGGGSISRSGWNNNRQALPRKDLASSSSRFAGNIKGSRKPLKGGGSLSRSGWNNNRQALPKKDLASSSSRFAGNIKGGRKPLKGGGSISKSGWNNDFKPLQKKLQPLQSFYASKFSGTLKMKSKYKDKPHAVKGALKAKEPDKNMFQMSGYQGTMKDRRNYSKKPNAHKDALKGVAPRKSVAKIDSYVPKYTKVRYSKKPNAHKDALKGIAPKNSASKAIAFQGNFKVKKNYDKNMHPSSKYTTSLQPRNSLEEKNKTFKFNIWWAKLFKKNENQPTVVKEKTRNPRYDKREKDLWYD